MQLRLSLDIHLDRLTLQNVNVVIGESIKVSD